jgi:hypothetical protein
MSTRILRKGFAGAVITAGALALTGSGAFASSTGPTGATGSVSASFTVAQQKLEVQLAGRATRLDHLASDVSGATTLTPAHAAILSARIGTELADINGLIAKVPTDTTKAELNADRTAMLKDNRVYAVMTPQVFETISADAATVQLNALQANEPVLATEVATLVGQPGYRNAVNHDNNYVTRVANQSTKLSNLVTSVLAQQPSGYPGNTHFFVRANHDILNANVAIAYANYDASVIALATGGYTGS